MFSKTNKSHKKSLFQKTALLPAIFVVIFFGFGVTPIYAQYYNNCQNGYSYYYNQPVSQPTIRTGNATNITSSSATLSASVIGYNVSNSCNFSMWFEYGRSSNFGYSTQHNYFYASYPNFSANIASLDSNTVYYFRAVAQGPQGVVYGNTTSFMTSFPYVTNTNNNFSNSNPSVTTNPATSVSSTSVNLNSFIINSPSSPFTVWFDWGETTNFGNRTPMSSLETLSSANHVSAITKLSPGTTYYFRAVAQNPYSRINGATLSFTTSGALTQNNNNVTEKVEKSVTQTNTNKENVVNKSITESVDSTLGANLISSGSFLPVNAFGWLLLSIFILVLLLLVKYLYHDFFDRKIEEKH